MIITAQINGNQIKYFDSINFTFNEGRQYKLVAAEIIETKKNNKTARRIIHTVRNQEGELKEFEHDELIQLIEQYP